MHLTAEFMLQAAIELFRQGSITRIEATEYAFNWGISQATDSDHSRDLPSIFLDQDTGRELEDWTSIKDEYMSEVRMITLWTYPYERD